MPRLWSGVLVSVLSVAATTGVIFGLQKIAPVLSLGVLYVFPVLIVAIGWGLAFAIPVSVASMLAFNFFFLPPVHTLALRDSENWFALAVYLVTAIVVSDLAARARRRAVDAEERQREAERLAEATVEAESLRRSDAFKTALLRAVSHDLRSPLTTIKAATEGLENADLDLRPGDREELLSAIRLEADRLDRLVANLLDVSRLEVGAARAHPELWPVDELVGRALDGLGPAGERVSVISPEQSPLVQVDAVQVERALVNVLENALKFSRSSKEVQVEIGATRGEVRIAVDDEGMGLEPDELEAIFQPFQLGSAAGGLGGSGLGLAIARGFVQANGGRIWAEARPRGARFVLALPLATADVRVHA